MNACPICGGGINVPADVTINELLDCGECNSELELVSRQPVRLAEAPIEAEDWGE